MTLIVPLNMWTDLKNYLPHASASAKLEKFQHMHVLKPKVPGAIYLLVSYWESEENYKAWTTSPAFLKGYKRAFVAMAKAREEGKMPPMKSSFNAYNNISHLQGAGSIGQGGCHENNFGVCIRYTKYLDSSKGKQ